jgi:hypothetical protein
MCALPLIHDGVSQEGAERRTLLGMRRVNGTEALTTAPLNQSRATWPPRNTIRISLASNASIKPLYYYK